MKRHKACDGCPNDCICIWQKREEVDCCDRVQEQIKEDSEEGNK